MDTIGDLVARERRSDDPALVAPRENRSYDYRRFCTTAWKTGNFWRRRGVHDDSTVAVADDPEPEAVFSFLGAALLGARTRFGPSRDRDAGDPAIDARVVVAPCDEIERYEVSPGTQRVAYGGPPDDPAVAHFERDVWSENPAFPETPVDPEAVALVARDERDRGADGELADREFSHADLLAGAREAADGWGLEPDDEVAVRAPLADPGTVVAGVLAPLLAGATILFPDGDAVGDFAVAEGDAPESAVVRPVDALA
ncbi:hypothetical protein NGM10_04295 [Halorussus salilacus]|uniref:hypothetical protein n=1 Tax=Halorussus salilacus TaxID=2953750 RepID=UPI00209D0943|nr:hypothetical protein [Halorussus salilacus]USZ68961.1 hypothetical protein NGM10_04295 [Halorussus salilacus]